MGADDTPTELLTRLRAIGLALPDAYEEEAWVGVRWRIRHRTFAHLLTIADGWPPAYARATHTDGPAHVVMLRASGAELDALRNAGHPFFPTPWRVDEIGVHLDTSTDWTEIAELVTDSYCTQAPQNLVRLLDRAGDH